MVRASHVNTNIAASLSTICFCSGGDEDDDADG